jgi:hypothetical protein
MTESLFFRNISRPIICWEVKNIILSVKSLGEMITILQDFYFSLNLQSAYKDRNALDGLDN